MCDKGPTIDPNLPLARALGVERGQAESPPPPHSEFPIPRTWGEAWPIILWCMLAFALVLVFADSVAAMIEAPLLRAGAAAVALLGVTAMLIYRERLLAKLKNPSPRLIVAVTCTILWVLATSPFVEQRRWPFSAWFHFANGTLPWQTTSGPFLFAYKLPYIQTPQDRAGLLGWRFSVGFTPNRRLVAANPRIVYAEQYIAGKWKRIIPGNEEDNGDFHLDKAAVISENRFVISERF